MGEPFTRFQEDPLRMLRLIRFQATLGFRIAKKTERALPELVHLMSSVSPERVLSELNKMLVGRELLPALQTFYSSGLMEQVIPELAACRGISAGPSHPYDLLTHSLTAAHFAYPDLPLRWAALLHDLGKQEEPGRCHAEISAQMAEKLLKRLRASSSLITRVSTLIAHHMFGLHPHSSHKAVRRFVGKVGPETALELVKLRQADMAGMNAAPRQILAFGRELEARIQAVLDEASALTLQDLKIDGHCDEGANLKPGPIIGDLTICWNGYGKTLSSSIPRPWFCLPGIISESLPENRIDPPHLLKPRREYTHGLKILGGHCEPETTWPELPRQTPGPCP